MGLWIYIRLPVANTIVVSVCIIDRCDWGHGTWYGGCQGYGYGYSYYGLRPRLQRLWLRVTLMLGLLHYVAVARRAELFSPEQACNRCSKTSPAPSRLPFLPLRFLPLVLGPAAPLCRVRFRRHPHHPSRRLPLSPHLRKRLHHSLRSHRLRFPRHLHASPHLCLCRLSLHLLLSASSFIGPWGGWGWGWSSARGHL